MRRFDEKIEIAAGNENRTPNHGVAKTSQFSSLFASGIAIPHIENRRNIYQIKC